MTNFKLRCSAGYWSRITAILFAALSLFPSPGWAQSPSEQPRQLPITDYRRVFVPADAPDKWPTNGQRYLPLDTNDFLRLIERAQEQESQEARESARVASASYRAKLVGRSLLTGSVSYTLDLPGGRPQIVPLEPLNLSILSANWQGETLTPARWGSWKQGSKPEVQGLLAPRSGTVQLDWQLRAESMESSGPVFELDVPPAIPQTLELDLPSDYQVELAMAALDGTQTISDGRQRWMLQLASSGPYQLKLLRQTKKAVPQHRPRIGQATLYRLHPAGLDITTSIRVEPQDHASFELPCALSGGLKITSITLDGESVPWQRDDASTGETIKIRFPGLMKPRELKIHALAPLRLNQLWQLPKIRLGGAEWTESTAQLVVSPALELRSFDVQSATLEHIVGLQPESASLEAYRVQDWSEEASLELLVGRRAPSVNVEVATAADVGSNTTTARIAARINSTSRVTFQFVADLAADWSIESVKTEPAGALREWHVAETEDKKTLYLQLNDPIEPEQPLWIEFDARLIKPGSFLPTRAKRLTILDFNDAVVQRNLLLLRGRPQGQMELLNGVEAARIDPQTLSSQGLALLPSPIVGELIDLSKLSQNQVLALRPSRPRFEVEVLAELSILAQSSQHRYDIKCRPLEGTISQVEVEFDKPLPESAQWLLQGDPMGGQSLRRVVQPTTNTAATYLLKLPYAATETVRLVISHSTPFQPSTTFNPIRFPEAIQTSGYVVVRGPLDGLRFEDSGWSPVGYLHQPSVGDTLLPQLGCYRLASSRTGRIGKIPPLAVHRIADGQEVSALVAWLAEYQSHQAADGAAIYLAVYYLENVGASELEVTLPEYAQLQASWIDEHQLEPGNLRRGNQTYHFPLPADRRYPTLALQYVVHGPMLGLSTTIEPVLPQCSFPVSLGRWTLWTPERFVPDDQITGYSVRRVPWRERLFGPLARKVGDDVFNPLQAEDWPQLWSAPVEGLRTRLLAERFAARLADGLTHHRDQTWGERFKEIVTEMDLENTVAFDQVALRAAGIEASDRPAEVQLLKASAGSSASNELQTEPLARFRLVLLISPSRIVVTSSDRVAHWREALQPTASPRIYLIDSEHLSFEFEIIADQSLSNVVSAGQWAQDSAPPVLPWNDSFSSSMSGAGHRACTIEFIDELPTVVVRQAYVHQAYWYVIWLSTAAIGAWWLKRRGNRLLIVLAIAAAVCFSAPPHWLTVPQAVLVGLLSAVLWHLVRSISDTTVHDQSTRTITPRSTIAGISFCVMFAVNEVGGAPPLDDPIYSEHRLPPSVLIPVDEKGVAQGSDFYLPESFLAALNKFQVPKNHDDARYAVLGSVIQGTLHSESRAANLVSEPWLIRLKIESFVANAQVYLPFRRSEAIWDEKFTIDGKPTSLNWRTEGKGLAVELPATGVHHLNFVFRPKLQSNADRRHLELHVPRLSGTRMELDVPTDVDDLNIPCSSTHGNDIDGMKHFILSANGVLHLDWLSKGSEEVADISGEVEQLAWLHVEPAVAQLEVQWQLRGATELPKHLDLSVSSHLKPLPLGENSPVETIQASSNEPGKLNLRLKSGLDPETRVPLRFQIQRTSSLGRIYFPSVRLQGVERVRSFFAVSVGSGLSYQEETADFLRTLSSTEFTHKWGSDERSPQLVYSLEEEDPEWSLHVWPDRQTFSALQSLRLRCQSDGLEVEYRAALDQVAGKWLVHNLQTSANLQVDDVTVTDQLHGETVPLRWSRPRETQVSVLLGKPMEHSHLLTLRGRISRSPDGSVAIPKIILQGADQDAIRVDLYRSSQVLVDWEEATVALRRTPEPEVRRSSPDVYLGHYTWHANQLQDARVLHLTSNDPKLSADTVTIVDRDSSGRSAIMRARISVMQGVVDHLRVSVPEGFQEAYELSPEGIGLVSEVVNTAFGRELTVLLAQPVEAGEMLELEISGRMSSSVEGRLEVPNLKLIGVSRSRRFVVLPSRLDERSIEWRIAGLRREPLPESLKRLDLTSATQLPYRVISRNFRAREASYHGPLRNASLRYAWIDGAMDAESNLTATASLLVQPGRATHCSLRLPEGARLLQLAVDDQPVKREYDPGAGWRIALGPPYLPHLVTVSYIVQAQHGRKQLRLTPPEVIIGDSPLPAPTIDWNIQPVGSLRIKVADSNFISSRAAYTENRYLHSRQALEDAVPLALELPREELRGWLLAWHDHVRRVEESFNTFHGLNRGLVTAAKPFDDPTESTAYAQLLSSLDNVRPPDDVAVRLTYPLQLPQRATSSLNSPSVYLTSDFSGRLEIVCAPLVVTNVWRWIAAAVILVAGFMLDRFFQSRPGWIEPLYNRPYLLALMVGLLWWSLLAPSVAGLLVVTLTAIAFSFKHWRKHQSPRPTTISTQLTA